MSNISTLLINNINIKKNYINYCSTCSICQTVKISLLTIFRLEIYIYI